jgi:hypothetical protein
MGQREVYLNQISTTVNVEEGRPDELHYEDQEEYGRKKIRKKMTIELDSKTLLILTQYRVAPALQEKLDNTT